jgi:hypothetical protein
MARCPVACLVMIAPALVLTALRLIAAQQVEPVLHKLAAWLTRNAAETTAWIVAIVGILIARNAAGELGIINFGGVNFGNVNSIFSW